jgi:hypothetical protein
MVCDGKHLDRTIDAAIDDTEREPVECHPPNIWLNKNPVARRIVTDAAHGGAKGSVISDA